MKRINFENLPNTVTPINKDNLNKMQDNIEESCVAVSPTQPTTNEKVWIKKGKNILPSINIDRTINGITFIHNEDGSITMNGTATNKAVYPINVNGTNATNTIKLEENSNYILSGNNSSISGLYLQGWYTRNGSNVYTIDAIETTEETNLGVYITINSGVTVTNITIFPQVEQGSTATDYEPYIEKKIYCKNDNGVFGEFVNAETMGIETITNENGTATKFPDGTMICTLDTVVTDQAINTSYGSIYIGSRTWTFPVPFISRPVASCGVFRWGTSASWGSPGQPNSKNVDIRAFDFFSRESGTSCSLQVTAIGRWK